MYDVKKWALNDVVKPEDLNKIEDGIANLDAKIKNIDLTDNKINISDVNNNFTASKLDGVLDELFLSASSGKTSISNAIGEPAKPNDTFTALAQIIDNAQDDIKNAANLKGCNIPSNPNFVQIVNGINAAGHFLKTEQIKNLSAVVGFDVPGRVQVSWQNPTDSKFVGVRIMYKLDSYPTSETDGTLAYDSNQGACGTFTELNGLIDGTNYYIRGFAYTMQGSTRLYTDLSTGAECTAMPRQLKGQQVFTSSGVYRVPFGVSSVDVFLVGGGGSGLAALPLLPPGNIGNFSGGGGGYTTTKRGISVRPNMEFSVIIGAGGTAFFDNIMTGRQWGNDGGNTSITINGESIVANGGGGSYHKLHKFLIGEEESTQARRDAVTGVDGGSGGGSYESREKGYGGSDGGSGGGETDRYGTILKNHQGTGQGSTTRAFAENNGTLYAGGGGGGHARVYLSQFDSIRNPGGSGGGGYGSLGLANHGTQSIPSSDPRIPAQSGAAGTGGGGGGGSACIHNDSGDIYSHEGPAGNGGSGVVIIRWGY